jgi:hypothetical protein
MTNTALCGACGAQIPADAKFCSECGTAQDQQTEEPAHPEAAERVERVTPGAGELAGQLAAQLRTPGIMTAAIVGLAGVAAALVTGLVVALLTIGDSSMIGISDIGLVKEALLHATQAVAAPLSVTGEDLDYTFKSVPLLAVAIVVCALAAAAYLQAGRLSGMSPAARVAWCAAGALPFAVLMVIVAVAARADIDGDIAVRAQAGSVFGLSLFWGLIGGATGAALAIRRHPAEDEERDPVPPVLRPFARVAAAILRPLGLALLVAIVAATIVVAIQTARDAGGIVGERETVGAVVEDSAFGIEHGVHALVLGSFAKFEPEMYKDASLMPIPATKVDRIVSADGYRLFDYSEGVPALLFIPGMLLLIALPLIAMLYAGFAAARAAGATTALYGALWGAAVGPVWAVAMAILNALASKTEDVPLFGRGSGGSVFGFVLLVGLVVGAAGGALAAQAEPEPTPEPAV